MKNTKTSIAAALGAGMLALSLGAVAQDQIPPTAPPTHGETVREAAQRDALGKPMDPPGQTVRDTAHLQGDFMQLDADRNGTISRAELQSDVDLVTHFGTLDADGNGELSRVEFNSQTSLVSEPDEEEEVEDEE